VEGQWPVASTQLQVQTNGNGNEASKVGKNKCSVLPATDSWQMATVFSLSEFARFPLRRHARSMVVWASLPAIPSARLRCYVPRRETHTTA
jgi:hypothetical protein